MRARTLKGHRALVLCLTLCVMPALDVLAQPPNVKVEPVLFPAGHSSTVVTGTLVVSKANTDGYTEKGYSLHARAGQTLTLKIGPAESDVDVEDIFDPSGGSIAPAPEDRDPGSPVTVKLKSDGEYRIYITTPHGDMTKRVNPYDLTITLSGQAAAPASSPDDSFWIGTFSSEEGGGKVEDTLRVTRQSGKLTAIYKSVVTAQLYEYFTMTVNVNGDTASFYYDKCLPKEGDADFDGYDPYPCSEGVDKSGRYKTGDLMFKLVKTAVRNRIKILTLVKEGAKTHPGAEQDDFQKVK